MFLELPTLFSDPEEEKLEDLGLESNQNASLDYQVIDITAIECFNSAVDESLTTIRMKSGMQFMAVIPYEEFKLTIERLLGPIKRIQCQTLN